MVKKAAHIKPPLSDVNKIKRLKFARKWLVNGVDTLENVMWSDETKIQAYPSSRKTFYQTHESTLKKELPVQKKWHSGKFSVMLWGCFSKWGAGRLRAIDGTMNSESYIQTLRDDFLPEFNYFKQQFPGTWRLMQDNAPCHRSNATKAFLREEDVEFIDWAPYSPDLNPIENLWAWIKHQLHTKYPPAGGEDELIDHVYETWNTITPEMCGKYCANYERRLVEVIDNLGGCTSY